MTGKIAEITPERIKEVDEWVNNTIKPIHIVQSDFTKLLRKKNVVVLDEESEGEQTAFEHFLNPMKRREDYVVVKYYIDNNDEFTMLVQVNQKGITKVKYEHDKLFHVAFLKALTIAVSLFEDYFGSKTSQYKHLFKFFEAYRTWVNVNALAIKQHELPGITEDLPQNLPVITDELLEVKEVNYNELPYDEKVKHICHAINPNYPEMIDDLDWLKQENMKIFPFQQFTNFHVQEMKMVCDGCGEPFEGNGNYETAFFVHHSHKNIKLYHSLKHCYPEYLTYPLEFDDQMHGYLLPVVLPEKYIQSKVHRFVWTYLQSSAYKLNAFVPSGFKTIDECKKVVYRLDGDGGGSSIDNGVGNHKGMKLEWSKSFLSPKPEITLKPSDTLKIVNEILALCKPQSPLIDYVVLDAPTPNKEIQEIETENRSAGSDASSKTELPSEAKQPIELTAPGNNFRERYNNKKMRNRLIKQLEDMPADRRAYLIESIEQHFSH